VERVANEVPTLRVHQVGRHVHPEWCGSGSFRVLRTHRVRLATGGSTESGGQREADNERSTNRRSLRGGREEGHGVAGGSLRGRHDAVVAPRKVREGERERRGRARGESGRGGPGAGSTGLLSLSERGAWSETTGGRAWLSSARILRIEHCRNTRGRLLALSERAWSRGRHREHDPDRVSARQVGRPMHGRPKVDRL
jgi:hypothetical protein